jgi:NADPH-dependent ferric siderophore reductase
MSHHEHRLVRHPIVFRSLEVLRVERLTPHMQRIVVGGAALKGFISLAPDDHVKLCFPNSQGEYVTPVMGPDGPQYPADRELSPMRDYTPRRHDGERGELTLDFVLHGDGPAASWAAQAAPGQTLMLGGPRGSMVVADDFDHYVLAGDETALPAIGRWLEEMPEGTRATVFAEIPGEADRQALATRARVELTWLERDGAAPGERLEHALRGFAPPAGDVFYWIATESRRARAMRQFLSERGVPKEWLKATGYWKLEGGEDA